jgi:3'(2'), 5'-bisphosphate nucleotidase
VSRPGTTTDARLAADLAERAGRLLLELRAASGLGGPGDLSDLSGKALGDRGDHDANELLLAALADARPGDAVLSEESVDSPARLSADRVWIIDPLDGTREYCLPGREDWAVHVALWQRGRGITDAAVAQPSLSTVYASDLPAPERADRAGLRFLVSDSRPPAWAAPVAEALGADLAPMGSAGAKAMAVLRGDADAYLHSGGQWEWDSAAPVGVALAAGLHASRIDGSPLVYNEPHPYLPDLVICRADLSADLLREIAAADPH